MTCQVAISIMENDTPRVRGQRETSSAFVGKVIREISLEKVALEWKPEEKRGNKPSYTFGGDQNHLGKMKKHLLMS